MKFKLITLLLSVFIFITGCSSDKNSGNNHYSLEGGEWVLTSYVDTNDNKTELLAVSRYTLSFNTDLLTVNGSFDCNQLSANITLDGLLLSFDDVSLTEIFCGVFDVDYDQRNNFILSVLNRLESYEIVDNTLTLTSIRGEKLIYSTN